MSQFRLLVLLALIGCSGGYSADTYNTRAMQQANPVQQGVIIGARDVLITSDGATGAAVGGAAGGIVGGSVPGSSLTGALGTVGGGLVGGLFGSAAERVAAENRGTEYIVRRTTGELVSVTQKDVPPLPVGQRVLVITGVQARVVPDYTVEKRPASAVAAAPSVIEAPVRADPPDATTPPPAPLAPLVPPDAPLAL